MWPKDLSREFLLESTTADASELIRLHLHESPKNALNVPYECPTPHSLTSVLIRKDITQINTALRIHTSVMNCHVGNDCLLDAQDHLYLLPRPRALFLGNKVEVSSVLYITKIKRLYEW